MKDGGPAFPSIIPIEHSEMQGKDYPNFTESGMSLRDWFAGQYVAGRRSALENFAESANLAYQFADALLKERGEGGKRINERSTTYINSSFEKA